MDYEISELEELDIDQLKNLCRKLGLSTQIQRQDLISRLVSKFPPRTNSTDEIIQIKQEICDDHDKFTYYSSVQSKIQHSAAKSVASDHGTLNSELSMNFGLDSSPLNSTSYSRITKPAPASFTSSNSKNIQNGKNLFSPKTFSFKPIIVKEKTPVSVSEELERRRKRAERFNGHSTSKSLNGSSLKVPSNLPVASLVAVSCIPFDEKLRKRAQRFGLDNSSTPSKISSTSKVAKTSPESKNTTTKTKPLERSKVLNKNYFIEEDKTKLEARSQRFKVSSSSKIITKEDPSKLIQRSKRFKIAS